MFRRSGHRFCFARQRKCFLGMRSAFSNEPVGATHSAGQGAFAKV